MQLNYLKKYPSIILKYIHLVTVLKKHISLFGHQFVSIISDLIVILVRLCSKKKLFPQIQVRGGHNFTFYYFILGNYYDLSLFCLTIFLYFLY